MGRLHAVEPRTLIHIDMDAFFAAVEQRDRPELRNRPTLVGRTHRGVVAACSYEARRYGIHSAMPMQEALRRCKDAIVVAPRIERYREVSRAIFKVFARYTPAIQALSIDEATLDVTHSRALFGDGETIANSIRSCIADEESLPCSAGVAHNRFLAKLACERAKPNGLNVWPTPAQTPRALGPLPVETLFGVGPEATRKLHRLGIHTLADVQRWPLGQLKGALGALGEHVGRLARGEDDRPIVSDEVPHQVGSEATFSRDLTETVDLERALLEHALNISLRLMKMGAYASRLQVKLKTHDFKVVQRESTLPAPAFDADSLFAGAKRLLNRFERAPRGYRLAGLSARGLSFEPPAPMLLPVGQQKSHEAIERARAQITAKYGAKVLTRATLLEK